MSAIPTETPEWGTDSVEETRVIDDAPVVLPNKTTPSQEYKDSGVLHRENLPRPYFNFIVDLLCRWAIHLNERYSVGTFVQEATTETATTINAKLGGTWLDHGTFSVTTSITGSVAMRLFEKTA